MEIWLKPLWLTCIKQADDEEKRGNARKSTKQAREGEKACVCMGVSVTVRKEEESGEPASETAVGDVSVCWRVSPINMSLCYCVL